MSISYKAPGRRAMPASLVSSPATETTGHKALLCWSGQLDAAASISFLTRARTLYRSCGCLIADLSGIDFLDSDGVRALLLLREEMEKVGRELRLVVPAGSRADRTLTLLQLMDRLQVYRTVTEASSPRPPS